MLIFLLYYQPRGLGYTQPPGVEDKLETVGSLQDTPDQQLEQPLQNFADPLDADFYPTLDPGSESELDSDIEDVDCKNFVQTVLEDLWRCTRCMLSFYFSLKCQRDNWWDHKVACSIVAAHIAKECGYYYVLPGFILVMCFKSETVFWIVLCM